MSHYPYDGRLCDICGDRYTTREDGICATCHTQNQIDYDDNYHNDGYTEDDLLENDEPLRCSCEYCQCTEIVGSLFEVCAYCLGGVHQG